MTTPMLVSLHLPKTAGTSLRYAMRAHYGARLLEDYDAPPMQVSRGRRELSAMTAGLAAKQRLSDDVTAIHGHFLPLKYRIALRGKAARYATWLRDPVERVQSHYHYWCRDYAGDDHAQPLRNRVVAERWSLERFCLGPEMRNLYGQYLWGFDRARFEFIGITERYDTDFTEFAQRYLGGDRTASVELPNPDRDGERYVIDAGLRARIAQHHAADMALYEWALARPRSGLAFE
ncbi:MAG: hypothetical protein ABIO38_01000 [Luteimonas sp.]